MKWKTTWWLVILAGALFAFIWFFERHTNSTSLDGPPVPRLLGGFKRANVTSVQLRRGTQFALRVERSGAQWNFVQPKPYPAAPVAIESLLENLERLTPQAHISPSELADRKQTPADFGFDPPQAVLLLQLGPDKPEIQFGERTAAGDQVYLRLAGSPGIYVVGAELFDRLPRALNDWRDAALLHLGSAVVDRLEVVRGAGGFQLQRDATNKLWRLARPVHRADTLKVDRLLEQLTQARVFEFVADQPIADLEPYGLQPPEMELALGQGAVTQRVQFGRSPVNDPANVYARRLSHSNVVLIAKTLVDALATPPSELRERRLLNFDPAVIDSIEVRSEEPFTVRKGTDDLWTTGQPLTIETNYVPEWLAHFSEIQVTDFVKDVVTDFSPYGLASTNRRYLLKTTITNAAGITNVVVAQLDFSTNQNERVFVRRADEDSVYAITALDYHPLPSAAWQLRDHHVWSFATNQVVAVNIRQHGKVRRLVRAPSGNWTLASGSSGVINPWAVEETLFRLGDLQVIKWVGRGDAALPAFGFSTNGYAVSIELKIGDRLQTNTVEFGGVSPIKVPYAATVLDGQRWIYEFPWPLYLNVVRDLGIPKTSVQLAPPESPEGSRSFAVFGGIKANVLAETPSPPSAGEREPTRSP